MHIVSRSNRGQTESVSSFSRATKTILGARSKIISWGLSLCPTYILFCLYARSLWCFSGPSEAWGPGQIAPFAPPPHWAALAFSIFTNVDTPYRSLKNFKTCQGISKLSAPHESKPSLRKKAMLWQRNHSSTF